MLVESFALPVRPRALTVGGGALWIADAGGRILSLEAFSGQPAAPRERARALGNVLDLSFSGGRVLALLEGGRVLTFDPEGGKRLDEISLPDEDAMGLAVKGAEIWYLEGGGRLLRRSGDGKDLGPFRATVRSPCWEGDSIWAISATRPAARSRFRWRGLAPGAGPFPGGPGSEFALVRLAPDAWEAEARVIVPQEPSALAVSEDHLWYGVVLAEGLERICRPGRATG